jgi:hypothetical protein
MRRYSFNIRDQSFDLASNPSPPPHHYLPEPSHTIYLLLLPKHRYPTTFLPTPNENLLCPVSLEQTTKFNMDYIMFELDIT